MYDDRSADMMIGSCNTLDSESYYSNMYGECMALWEVDITAEATQGEIQIFYGKTALADADAGIWLDCSDADDQLDQWHVGRNYTCWFDPDEKGDYYYRYAWFDYDPGDGSINYFALGVTFLVFAGLIFGGVSVLLLFILCAAWSDQTEVSTPTNQGLSSPALLHYSSVFKEKPGPPHNDHPHSSTYEFHSNQVH
ncbi:hypothetical protein Pelo_18336 [Pelomyxa schiedti]|nr:hypothetical protein Pelo_18336 [Pelomyxa schiedti]